MPTINGVNYTPFEKNKNAIELGIDLSRRFIVVKESLHSPQVGDILEIKEDDNSDNPYFWNLTRDNNGLSHKHYTKNKWECVAYWSQLAYYDEPKTRIEVLIEEQNRIATEARIEQYKRDGLKLSVFNNELIKELKNYKYKIPTDTPKPWGKVMPDGKIHWGRDVASIIKDYYKLNNTPTDTSIVKGNKIMSIITNAFKSKEDKALEYFNLGDSKQLNEEGRREFVNYIFETGDTTKKGFLSKMVEAYKEEKK